MEAAYVGNRGVWLPAPSLVSLNAIPPDLYRSLGLDITNAADRQLLTSTISSAAAQARGFRPPYAGYPTGATVAQSLRPFPQFSPGLSPSAAPVGNSWYDSLQVKLTKRLSYGLQLGTAFTWGKALARPPGNSATTSDLSGANDIFNRQNQKAISSTDQPLVLAINFSYEIPTLHGQDRILRAVAGGWTFGGLLRYQSGMPISTSGSTNNLSQVLFQGTVFNRVPGEPLFQKAWSDPAPGQWGTAALYYSDYRYARRPDEQLSLGKIFRIREAMSFHVRAEFFNVFNRTYLGNPSAGNPLQTPTRNALGVPTSGFGRIDATAVAGPPRNGQLVARFVW